MSAYYFDVLPIHPPPERLESFTSYLTRLAEANGIWSVSEMSRLCFPDGHGSFTINAGDYPPISLGALPTVAACPEPTLLTTTLYHLGRKFGRITRPQPLSQFLSGSLAPGLRYCPHCLAERGHYSLVWRFLEVKGCPEHGCRLLDRCEHCGQTVPLLTLPLRLGICPTCGGDLRTCRTELLGVSICQSVRACHDDIAFLLSPQSLEASDRPMAKSIGEQLARWRQVRRLKVADAADYIGQVPAIIYYIEGGPEHRGVKFQWYRQYADFLKVKFRTMFETPLPHQPVRTYEDRLIDKVQQAIMSLEQRGKPITQRAICQMLGISPLAFSKNPRVREIWSASQARQYRQREAELVNQVHQIAESLVEAGRTGTQREICRQLGWSVGGLKDHPQAKTALKQVIEQTRVQYEEKLLKAVQVALARLETTGQSVSKQAISQIVGVSTQKMDRRPKVRTFLVEQVLERQREHQAKQFRQREQELVNKVQQAIAALTAAGQPVTRNAICKLINRSKSSLESYPWVQVLLKEVALANAQARK